MMGEVIAQYGSGIQSTFQHTGLPIVIGTTDEWDILKRLSAISAGSGTLLVLEFHLHKDGDSE